MAPTTSKNAPRIALVTGANRGLGLETSLELAKKGVHVIVTARSADKAKQAAAKIAKETGGQATPLELDVSKDGSGEIARRFIETEFGGRLDILVNNAGILESEASSLEGSSKEAIDELRHTMETNVYGPYRMMKALIPLMQKNHYGRVVNVSSGMGQLVDMNGGYPSYRVSKTALNALTRIFATDSEDPGIKVNSVCPGWVKTDMGGSNAERSIPEGADTIVWLATLPDSGPTAGFFRDREAIDW